MDKRIEDRIRYKDYVHRVISAEKASAYIQDGMTVGLSGFTRAGEAKAVPLACIERARKEPFKINVYTGASLGSRIDELMAEVGMVEKRIPFQADRTMRQKINEGEMFFLDEHLSHMAEKIRNGVLAPIDVAVIEAVAITEEGHIIPTTSVGNSALFAKYAKHVIIELNIEQPAALEGLHDIYNINDYGEREPISIMKANDRIGTTAIPVDPEKVAGIVITHQKDSFSTITEPDEETEQIAAHLIQFLQREKDLGRIGDAFPPLQSGIGTVANAVMYGILETDWENIDVYSEVLQDAVFDLLDAGKVRFASGCSMTLSERKMDDVMDRLGDLKEQLVLRPQEISNHPEVIRRLGLISINTALEFDIYGNVNSTHVGGTHMMNGIGGSGDFARNARYAIFVTKSTAKDGLISSVVPFVSHVDHTEHDVDVVITEQGYADIRGLSPRERAEAIIENCMHPSYRSQMREYYEQALAGGGQTPHLLAEAFSWHARLKETGSMYENVTKFHSNKAIE